MRLFILILLLILTNYSLARDLEFFWASPSHRVCEPKPCTRPELSIDEIANHTIYFDGIKREIIKAPTTVWKLKDAKWSDSGAYTVSATDTFGQEGEQSDPFLLQLAPPAKINVFGAIRVED